MNFIKNFVNFVIKRKGNKLNTLKFKKLHPDAVLPTRAHDTDAGLDLTCTAFERNEKEHLISYKFGLAVEIPPGYVGLLFSRSSVSKKDLMLKNSVGVIDSDYRGELIANFHVTKNYSNTVYTRGDKAAQLLIVPIELPQAAFVDELSDTTRGTGSFGSTGG